MMKKRFAYPLALTIGITPSIGTSQTLLYSRMYDFVVSEGKCDDYVCRFDAGRKLGDVKIEELVTFQHGEDPIVMVRYSFTHYNYLSGSFKSESMVGIDAISGDPVFAYTFSNSVSPRIMERLLTLGEEPYKDPVTLDQFKSIEDFIF